MSDLEKAIELQPSNPDMYVNLGLKLKRAKRYEQAKKVYIKSDKISNGQLAIFPDCMGDMLNCQEEWERAVKLYTMALERSSKVEGRFRPEETLVSRGYSCAACRTTKPPSKITTGP